MTIPLLYDCDPGNDTAVAIMAAAGHPEIDLLAVTTVAGHSPAEQSAHNAAIAVHHAGSAVPVTRGSEKPLVRDQVLAGIVDLERGLDRFRDDLPAVELDSRHSVDLIVETAREHPGLVVVASGPLTNIASALRKDPGVAGNIARVVTLSGAWGLGGKTAAAEFNVWCDPEAASVVYGSGLPLTVLPTDATTTVPIDDPLISRVAEPGTASAVLSAELLSSLKTTHRTGVFGPTPVPLHDPCAVLYAADPSLGQSVTVRADVELAGRYTYGRTVIDLGGKSSEEPNADVVIRLDAARVHDALVDALRRLPARAGV
ncbi:nucleoside hydrolase [Streptomyces sp. TP-A0874]|uniref:nucleoside hydrolase n=1 Tax=Streptomyces sp. TP-A0874 TaxID=549819 RepID=UPI00085356FA|nr:nucleoside hydrolase [Streptomyces sp. TP-A0874]